MGAGIAAGVIVASAIAFVAYRHFTGNPLFMATGSEVPATVTDTVASNALGAQPLPSAPAASSPPSVPAHAPTTPVAQASPADAMSPNTAAAIAASSQAMQAAAPSTGTASRGSAAAAASETLAPRTAAVATHRQAAPARPTKRIPEAARRLVSEGQKAYARQDYSTAIANAKAALTVSPSYAPANALLERAEGAQQQAMNSISIH